MKKYLIKVLLFIMPLSLLLIEGFLPDNEFTYRPWEALVYIKKEGAAFPFYPNRSVDMTSEGDLCHHTDRAIKKRENWITDKLGYRNNTFIEDPDIVLIGDSFIAGSSLPQDSTLANLIKYKTNLKVYSIAPANINDFLCLVSQKIIRKPKTLIVSSVERAIPPAIDLKNLKYNSKNESAFSVFKDKVLRMYSIEYIKARLGGSKYVGVNSIDKSGMFFLGGKDQKYPYSEINNALKNIASYKKICDSLGVKFIYLPLPDKETVYFEKVPFDRQPDFINRLSELLTQNSINNINTLLVFNEYRTNSSNLTYHLDDTHWNAVGADLIAKEIIRRISF
jgi:hypothetical protein